MYLGLLIMCGFVLFDTQLIIEKAENGDKDYVWWGNVLTASKVPMSPLSAGLHFPITKCCANASSHSEPYNWASVLKKSNLMHHIVLSDELAARSTWWCSSVGLTLSRLTDFCSREGDSQLVDNSIFDDDPEATTSSDKRQHNTYLNSLLYLATRVVPVAADYLWPQPSLRGWSLFFGCADGAALKKRHLRYSIFRTLSWTVGLVIDQMCNVKSWAGRQSFGFIDPSW